MKPIVAVFDADDTLWMNEWQYSRATSRFFDYLYTIFQGKIPNLHYLKDRFYKIDGELFKEWGVKRGRMAESMVRLYKEVCEWAKWRFGTFFYDHTDEEKIRTIGDLPFHYIDLRWLPEARTALSLLKENGHSACLLTCYDTKVFPHRAKFMKLYEFFPPERIRATEFRKTKEDFIAVSGWTPEKDKEFVWVAVGNADSDILPALEISENWHGVRIPHGSTSKYCEDKEKYLEGKFAHFMPPPLIHPRSIDIRSLSEFNSALQNLTTAH